MCGNVTVMTEVNSPAGAQHSLVPRRTAGGATAQHRPQYSRARTMDIHVATEQQHYGQERRQRPLQEEGHGGPRSALRRLPSPRELPELRARSKQASGAGSGPSSPSGTSSSPASLLEPRRPSKGPGTPQGSAAARPPPPRAFPELRAASKQVPELVATRLSSKDTGSSEEPPGSSSSTFTVASPSAAAFSPEGILAALDSEDREARQRSGRMIQRRRTVQELDAEFEQLLNGMEEGAEQVQEEWYERAQELASPAKKSFADHVADSQACRETTHLLEPCRPPFKAGSVPSQMLQAAVQRVRSKVIAARYGNSILKSNRR